MKKKKKKVTWKMYIMSVVYYVSSIIKKSILCKFKFGIFFQKQIS